MRTWLKNIRGDIPQNQIASATGITQQLYSWIERGVRNPSVEVANAADESTITRWKHWFQEISNYLASALVSIAIRIVLSLWKANPTSLSLRSKGPGS